jgi:hypothetical protein
MAAELFHLATTDVGPTPKASQFRAAKGGLAVARRGEPRARGPLAKSCRSVVRCTVARGGSWSRRSEVSRQEGLAGRTVRTVAFDGRPAVAWDSFLRRVQRDATGADGEG